MSEHPPPQESALSGRPDLGSFHGNLTKGHSTLPESWRLFLWALLATSLGNRTASAVEQSIRTTRASPRPHAPIIRIPLQKPRTGLASSLKPGQSPIFASEARGRPATRPPGRIPPNTAWRKLKVFFRGLGFWGKKERLYATRGFRERGRLPPCAPFARSREKTASRDHVRPERCLGPSAIRSLVPMRSIGARGNLVVRDF